MRRECAAMPEKKIRGAVVGVTDDGYLVVTEDYSYPYFTGTDQNMPAVREYWYYRYADFHKSTKPHMHSSICRCMENGVDTRFGFMKNKEWQGGNDDDNHSHKK